MPEIIDIIETQEKAPALLPWQWLVIVLLTIAIAIIIYRWLKKQQHKARKINNLEDALTALKKVEEISNSEKKDNNWLTVELSLITRSFLQGQFNNQSLFQTHEEFIRDHEDLEKLPGPAREKLATYLTTLAAHKYAPDPHLPAEKNKLIQLTESLLRGVESTVPKDL